LRTIKYAAAWLDDGIPTRTKDLHLPTLWDDKPRRFCRSWKHTRTQQYKVQRSTKS
jgi:hypothetical protein